MNQGFNPTVGGKFFSYASFLFNDFRAVRWGSRIGHYFAEKWLRVIINNDFFEKGECYGLSLLPSIIFVLSFALCYFVLVVFSPFSIAITSLWEECANLSAFRTFVRFSLVCFCLFPLPLRVWDGLRLVIVALPGLFSYLSWHITHSLLVYIQSLASASESRLFGSVVRTLDFYGQTGFESHSRRDFFPAMLHSFVTTFMS